MSNRLRVTSKVMRRSANGFAERAGLHWSKHRALLLIACQAPRAVYSDAGAFQTTIDSQNKLKVSGVAHGHPSAQVSAFTWNTVHPLVV